MAKRVWVLDVYDIGQHIGQYVFQSEKDAGQAADWLVNHEGLEEVSGVGRDTGFSIGRYDPESYRTWVKAHASEWED
jgi:hypothetical protein